MILKSVLKLCAANFSDRLQQFNMMWSWMERKTRRLDNPTLSLVCDVTVNIKSLLNDVISDPIGLKVREHSSIQVLLHDISRLT